MYKSDAPGRCLRVTKHCVVFRFPSLALKLTFVATMIYARSLVAASLLSSVYASPSPANIYERDNTDGFVTFPVQAIDRAAQLSLRRRQAASPLANEFTGLLYQITRAFPSIS